MTSKPVANRRASAPASTPVGVTLLGPLPPLRAISAYTGALVAALAAHPDVALDVVSFGDLYPTALYPGGEPVNRDARPYAPPPGVRLRRRLHWWNPLGWILSGCTARGSILHAQWWTYALAPLYLVVLALARLRGKRVILTVHNVKPHEGGRLRAWLHRCVLPLAHVVIVHSEANRAAMARLTRAPVCVVPHGSLTLRSDLAGYVRDQRAAARGRLGLPADAEVVLLFGHLRPYKGLDVLLDAFCGVRARRPHARLLVVGQDWGTAGAAEAHIAALGLADAVTLRLGFASDNRLADALAASDVVAFPYTHFDGQSGAASLAIAAGLPLVVSRLGGLPDLVDEPAVVVEPGSDRDLARALVRVLADDALRERLRAAALTRAAALGWDGVAERTVAVYAEAVAPRAGRARRFPVRLQLRALIPLLVSAVAFAAIAIGGVDVARSAHYLVAANPSLLVAAGLAVIAMRVLRAWRWGLLFPVGGLPRPPLGRQIGLVLVSDSVNSVLPRAATTAGRAWLGSYVHAAPLARVAVTIAVELALDLATAVALLGVVLPFLVIDGRAPAAAIAVCGSAAAIALIRMVARTRPRLPARLPGPVAPVAHRLRAALTPAPQSGASMRAAMVASVAVHLARVAAFLLVAAALGGLPRSGVALAAIASAPSQLVPFTFGGLGVREAILIAVLSRFGVAPEVSVALGLTVFLVSSGSALLGIVAVPFMWKARVREPGLESEAA